ncbi:ABC transporter ATP-binding protein [Parapusillimonas sp. SGNA-6]|nr:ABC transporter ATP-binding protein [Parapusillimonas sp. SGNA-6]
MQLALDGINKKVGAETWLYDMSLSPQAGAVTVLLGSTQAGKTSLMRIMAGLDAPSAGRVMADGIDVTGKPVRERNVAMVYQQFINYPSLTVRENIASPMKLRGERHTDATVKALADKLHIGMFLDRLPSELSGGQQQRVALARALAKNAPLMLLDEPLVNLDYKLREELREELSQVFSAGSSTVVYATTEPAEALLLGGYTAVLDRGELLQYGPALEVFQFPKSLRVAQAFSDPPMNFVSATRVPDGALLPSSLRVPLPLPAAQAGGSSDITVGLRANSLHLQPGDGDLAVTGQVELAEISGSDTFVHLSSDAGHLVAQVSGVHHFDLAATVTLYFSPSSMLVFDAEGDLVLAPKARGH